MPFTTLLLLLLIAFVLGMITTMRALRPHRNRYDY